MSSEMLRRHAATLKTQARFDGKALDFGPFDCVRMLRSHLVAMGHRGLPRLPRYTTLLGAQRALKASGFADLEALIDSILPRITPAAALLGDIVLLRGGEESGEVEGAFGSVAICLNSRKLFGFGWVDDQCFCTTLVPFEYKAAWRA